MLLILAGGGLMAYALRANADQQSSDQGADGPENRAQIYVDDDRVQCPNAQYTSIQAAIMLITRPRNVSTLG